MRPDNHLATLRRFRIKDDLGPVLLPNEELVVADRVPVRIAPTRGGDVEARQLFKAAVGFRTRTVKV